MEVQFNMMNLSSICESCLSVDRNLSVVSNTELREFYLNIIQPIDTFRHPLALCWECTAMIKKIIKYKKQVQDARRHLFSYMLHQSGSLPTLSSLTTHVTTQDSQITLQYDSISNITTNFKPLITLECTKKGFNLPRNEVDEKDTLLVASELNKGGTETKDDTLSGREREPEFIKVEDDADFDRCFEENNGNCDDLFSKTIIKPDPTKSESKNRTRKRKSKTHLEFDDSDDEPLKKKQEEEKPSGGRKKKEKCEAAVKARARREQPAGVIATACTARSVRRLGVPRGRMEAVALSWDEVEEERQKALASEAYLRHEHRCEHCAIGFNHTSKLRNHMKKHDKASGELECSVCRVRCQTQHALAAHRRRHRIRWRCCTCGALCSRAAVMADHCARVHGGDAPTHTCPVCPHTATTLSKLRHHVKSHAERQRCELCGKTFRDKSTLNTHLFIHTGEKEHACPSCGKLFLFKKAMQLHAATHAASALLYCHTCDMNFKNQMSYYQHMKYNLKHVDPARLKYACEVCGKKFMKASRLREHSTAVHLRLTPIACPEDGCGFACASRPVLRAHLRSAHRQLKAPRNHVCHRCGKPYTNKKTLEGHLRSHSGERPFACARCGASFGYEAALYNHTKLVHLKDKSTRKPQASNREWPSASAPVSTAEETSVPNCPTSEAQ